VSTTFPIDVTPERLIEFLAGPGLGTIRTISEQEIGRDVYLDPSPTTDDSAGVTMLLMAFNGATAEDLRAYLHDSPEGEAWRTRPPGPELGPEPEPPLQPESPQPGPAGGPCQPLHADGVTIRNSAGQRVSLCGYDMFTALRMLLDGQDLQPFIDESLRYGFNCWRVFGMASAQQNGYYTLSPGETGYYEAITHLVQRLSNVGIYLLWTTYADCQDIGFDLGVWQRVADVLRPYQHAVFLSGGNEWSKNHWDPQQLANPGLQWWSRGSDIGDAPPPTPYGSFVEFHPRRDYPKALDDTIASQTYIQYTYHCDVPLIIDEPPRMGEDGSGAEYTDPFIVWRFARAYASGCACAVLHMRPGQKGTLIAPGSLNDEIARIWQQGMQLA
jgi:hypothetical protein